MKLDIYQVDAFTSEPFHGNPAAVVPLDAWLPDAAMQAIAAENNLAETAFFVKNGGRYDIRWFTPKVEVPLCGHATLASSHVIFNEMKLEDGEIVFGTRHRGELRVTRYGEKLILDFPAYPMVEIEQSDALADALGVVPVKLWTSQDDMVIARLESETQVRELTPDLNALLGVEYNAVIVTAKGDTCDFASRMFAPRIGIAEDPVTGGMHCSLIPYWAGELGKNELFAKQVSARGGELFCSLADDRVKIGGNAVLYLKGEIYVGAADEKSAAA